LAERNLSSAFVGFVEIGSRELNSPGQCFIKPNANGNRVMRNWLGANQSYEIVDGDARALRDSQRAVVDRAGVHAPAENCGNHSVVAARENCFFKVIIGIDSCFYQQGSRVNVT